MNKIIKKVSKTVFTVVMATALFTSCDDFLSLEPLNSIVVENFWEKKSEVGSAIAACYDGMRGEAFIKHVIMWGEMRGDNITDNSEMQKDKGMHDYYTNNITPSNGWTSWAPMYEVINMCNTVLHYAPEAQVKDGNFSMDELHAYEAEALSIRALCYFYLIRTFQKVPLVTWATIGDDEGFEVPVSTEEEILTQIISDLEWSLKYIWSPNYFDDVQERKGFFNTNSVYALLADIHLWKGDYQICADYCQKIIDYKLKEYEAQTEEMKQGIYTSYFINGMLTLYEGYPLIDGMDAFDKAYNKIFYSGNSFESLFELQFDNESKKNEGLMKLYGKLDKLGGGPFSAASYLTNQGMQDVYSDKNDLRLFENLGYEEADPQQSYPVCKYRVQIYSSISSSSGGYVMGLRGSAPNWIIYRLTDVMLMRAEALAYLGGEENSEEAFKLVKAVNARSCLGICRTEYSQDYIKEIVLEERQRELMFEGKRWYDLVRMVRNSDNPSGTMSTLRSSYLLRKYQRNGRDAVARLGSVNNLFLPIAQTEIDVNPLLEKDQNPAYVY